MTSGAQSARKDDEIVEQLANLIDPHQCEEFLRRHPALLSAGTVRLLTEEVRLQVRSDTGKAVRIAEIAIAVARQLGDPETLAHSFRARGNAAYASGDHNVAVSFYDQALALFRFAVYFDL